MTSTLLRDARAISRGWLDELDLKALVLERVRDAGLEGANVDVLAVGKASREMLGALQSVPGVSIRRRLVITDATSDRLGARDVDVVVGEHPLPGPGSLEAGRRALEFLEGTGAADATVFLVSGGASSLCVAPVAPLSLTDLHALWDAVIAAGADITTLNQLRASVSLLSGGAVLAHVKSPRSTSLVLVDNVISGARWVASGLTFSYDPGLDEVRALLASVGLSGTPLGQRWLEAATRRREGWSVGVSPHENLVLAEPSMMLEAAATEARGRGYRVVDLGARVHGDVVEVTERFAEVLERGVDDGPLCVLGVGEVTVRAEGAGLGGRCQEFAWRLAEPLSRRGRGAVALARASDGRDFVEGVGGAWSDETTLARALALGYEWASVARAHDTYPALSALGQLLEGGHTGWNLCDLYLVLC